MTDTWERIHDAALTRHEDGGAELARLVIEADDPFQVLAAERDALKAEKAEAVAAALEKAINRVNGCDRVSEVQPAIRALAAELKGGA